MVQSSAGRSNAGKHTALRIRTEDESVTLNTVFANLQRLTATVQDIQSEIGEMRYAATYHITSHCIVLYRSVLLHFSLHLQLHFHF